MKYVVVDREPTGYWLDPRPYLELLPRIVQDLPPGARAFAQDSAHYDFAHAKCVKDLRLQAIRRDAEGVAVLTLAPNPWKHDDGLKLMYSDVASLDFVGEEYVDGDSRYGSLLLDELLPAEGGVHHELALTSGTLRIVAADVVAIWQPISSD